jgi:hypothetical protein
LAEDLFAPRPCRLAFGPFALRPAVIFLELVGAVERRRVL